MNEQTILDSDTHSGLVVTPLGQAGLKTAGTWATFLSILGFIGAGCMVIFSLFFLFASSMMMQAGLPFPVWILALLFVGLTVFMVVVYLKLYRFANKAKMAVAAGNANLLEGAMLNLGSFFQITGISTIVFLVLYILLVAVFGSSMMNPSIDPNLMDPGN